MGRAARKIGIVLGSGAAVAALALGPTPMASAASATPAGPAAVNCSVAYVPPPSTVVLKPGMKDTATTHYIAAMQQRLRCLHYWVAAVDGKYSMDTRFAVWAFKEVQAGKYSPPNPDLVDAATQAALASPKAPPVTTPKGGVTRIEINKVLQVMVLYKNNQAFLISHVSTAKYCRPDGCKWVTPSVTYHALRFIAGKVVGSLGPMWNPIVITSDGKYAIHGDPNPKSIADLGGVPLVPASHGCVRIPMDLSLVFHTYFKIAPSGGTPVYVTGPLRQ